MKKSDNVREKLIVAGMKIASIKNYDSVSIQEITDEANIPRGSFYYYFKTKEEFGIAVIQRAFEVFSEQMESDLKDITRSPRERLWNFFEIKHDYDLSNKNLYIKIVIDTPIFPLNMKEFSRERIANCLMILKECIDEGQRLTEIDQTYDSEMLAEFLFDTWFGMTIRMQSTQNMKSIEICRQYLFNKILS